MRQITESQYQLALSRIEELLPMVGEDMSADDPKAVELAMMSDIVIDYEESHYPIEKPSVAELITDGLKEMKLTQKELAKQLGVSTTMISLPEEQSQACRLPVLYAVFSRLVRLQ